MPGNENPFTLNEQTQVLKDIRDSIRHQGSVSAGMPLASGRPTPQFIATQQSLDRMVAGQWATMGWADAYQTPIRTSLANDLMGVLGLRAAPQSMWQREYELFAGGMLQNRLSSFPADIIMPGFGRRSREMGAAMYQMSSRFNRAGDNRATDINSILTMGREIQLGAATDPRLSGQDYNSIMEQSAGAGQFDFARGIGDVQGKFRELRDAVADLTKTMRVGASEVAQTFGAFRQFGIVDVADQRRMAERMSVTARVAGLSTPEMAAIVRSGMEGGRVLGIGAEGAAGLAENLAMAAREASRSGLISGNIMSAAGGVQGMVQSQQNAIQQFMASNMGYYALRGGAMGGPGGMLGNLMAGIGGTGGTLGGILQAEAQRQDILGGMSGAAMGRAYTGFVNQQLGMLGVNVNGSEAQNYAFQLARGQMGDPAALAWARQNYTAEGRQQQWQNTYRTGLESQNQTNQANFQRYFENESFVGRMRQMSGVLGRGAGQLGIWGGRQLSHLATWGAGWVGNDISTFRQAYDQQGLYGTDELTPEAAIAGAAGTAHTEAVEGDMRLSRTKMGYLSAASIGTGLAGAVAGFKAGTIIGTAVAPVFGPLAPIVPILGGVAGAIGGGYYGMQLGAGVFGDAGYDTLKGDEASAYRSAYQGSVGAVSQRVINIANEKGDSKGVLNTLANNQDFKKLLADFTAGGKLSSGDSRAMAKLAASAATATRLSAGEVMGVARQMGVDVEMETWYNAPAAGAKRYSDSMKTLMADAVSTNLSIASAEVATGVKDFAEAKDDTARLRARHRLTEAGIAGESLNNLVTGIDKMSQDDRTRLVTDAGNYVDSRGSEAYQRRLGAFSKTMEHLAAEATDTAGKSEAAVERIKKLEEDPNAMLDLMMGKGSAEDNDLRESLIRSDQTGTLLKIKHLGSMQDLMREGTDQTFEAATGLKPEVLKRLRAAAEKRPEAGREADMQKAAAMMMMSQTAAAKEANDPATIAADNMKLAADILQKLASDIHAVESGKGGTHR